MRATPGHSSDAGADARQTETICFEVDGDLALAFRQTARQRMMSLDDLMHEVLAGCLDASLLSCGRETEDDKRKHQRTNVSLPAMMEITIKHNETQCKPVRICNISIGGVGIRMDVDSHEIRESLLKNYSFTIAFCLPSVSHIVRLACSPVLGTRGDSGEFGAAFQMIPQAIRHALAAQFGL